MSKRTILLVLAALAAGLILGGCTKDMQSIYDPVYNGGATPHVTAVNPPSNGLAAVTEITLTGTNFSATAGQNIVYFDATPATIVSESATQIVVKAPNLVKDSIKVRVAVFKVDSLSNTTYFSLAAPVLDFGNVTAGTEPWGSAINATNNLFVSFKNDSVYKYALDGKTKSGYSTPLTGNRYTSLKFGPGGVLYGVRLIQVIYSIPQAPTAAAVWANLGAGVKAQDIDFDPQYNIWVCGNNLNVYRVTPAKNIKSFSSPGYLRSVRVFVSGGQQYIYFGGYVLPDSAEMVIRYPYYPTGDSLGARQVVFNYTTSPLYTAGKGIYAITFSAAGDLFIGTDDTDPIVVIPAGGAAQIFDEGVLGPTLGIFAWGPGATLYAIQGASSNGALTAGEKIKAINTLLTSAPYYGLQ
jgi:hypothetical protein